MIARREGVQYLGGQGQKEEMGTYAIESTMKKRKQKILKGLY